MSGRTQLSDEVERHRLAVATAHLVTHGLNIGDAAAPGTCLMCRRETLVARRRINTAYANDRLNWQEGCQECFEQTLEYYRERWDDYYAAVMG